MNFIVVVVMEKDNIGQIVIFVVEIGNKKMQGIVINVMGLEILIGVIQKHVTNVKDQEKYKELYNVMNVMETGRFSVMNVMGKQW